MKIIVLVKHAFITEDRPSFAADGKGFEKEKQIFEMNDCDRYALEEALKIKEQMGGEVVAISVNKDCDETLVKCFALGADRAIKIPFDSTDSWQIAEVIYEAVKEEKFDLILAGFQSQDLNNALVGPILAGLLKLPYATAVTSVEFEDNEARIRRELEAGYQEENTVQLPCLLTVQTGINEPKYPSFSRLRKARSNKIEEISVTAKPANFEIKKIYFPTIKKGEMLEGSPEQISAKLIEVAKERGLL